MADLPPLATSTDYIARHGTLPAGVDSDQVDQLLADISGQVREAAGWQQISRVDNDTVVLRGSGLATMRLPQRPVIDVTVIGGLTAGKWSWDGRTLTRLDGHLWTGQVTVTYSHGYDTVPAWLVGICCFAVRRALNNQAGLRAESTTVGDTSKSKTYATETVNVAVMLTDEERDRIASAFTPSVSVVAL